MNAYFTTNNGYDAIVIPAKGTALTSFTGEDLISFLKGSKPNFEDWCGDESCSVAESEQEEFEIAATFGTIVAQRVAGSQEARFLALGSKHDELLALLTREAVDLPVKVLTVTSQELNEGLDSQSEFEALEFSNGLIAVAGETTHDWFFENRESIEPCGNAYTVSVEETGEVRSWSVQELWDSIKGSASEFGEDAVPSKAYELIKG